MVRCPGCQTENPAGQKFCGECGGRLAGVPPGPADRAAAAVAPLSQAVVPASAFRDAAPVSYTPKHLAEKILRTRDAFEGERKQVTVMFADVSGFTAMASRLDPEEVHAIMDRSFEVILEAVHRFEGTVNQFLGDGVMAIFGAPIAHEDHPHRALRAALAIQDGLSPLKREIRQRHGVKFRIRMGINTGLVVVGAIGRDLRMDYTAVGDTTNLAARLLSIAGPGQIVVSKRTKRPTQGFFTFEELGEFTVKGKDEPVRAFLVTGEMRGRTRLEVSRERGLTPLAGRKKELVRLVEAYDRAAAGDGGVVLVAGEPGVGKSRLLYEFLRRIEGTGVFELEAACVSHGRSMPFHPVIELVRRCLALPDAASEPEVRLRAAERLGQEEMEEPPTLLAHFLGVPAPEELVTRLGGAQLRQRTLVVLRDLFLEPSATRPVVLVVENLHWLDPSSEEFLRHLAAAVQGRRVLLVLSTRPGSVPAWLAAPGVETLALEGLDADEIERMVRALVGVEAVSPGLLDALLARGEGNPLYVEEIVRQLQETGRLVVEGAEARLAAADVAIPKSIHDIIAARVDRLNEAVKDTLRVAAVVGRTFAVTLLARVLETDGVLAEHLGALQSLDLVFPVQQEPEPVYSFKHALIQEVAYGSLLERHRRQYHALVGRRLEEMYPGLPETAVSLLAHHFWRSGEDDKAVDYAILAGEAAQRRWAQSEALAQFDGALKRLGTMPDIEANQLRRIDAVIKQSEIMFALGRHAEHVRALEAIRDVVGTTADGPRRAAWYCWAGLLHSLTGARPEIPIRYCREALAIADAGGLEEIRAISECCLTQVYAMVGRLREALEAGERALGIFEGRGNVWWACRTLWGLSMAANASGLWGRSLEYCRRGLEHGRAVNDLRLKVTGWWRTGSTNVQRGDSETGLRCYAEALALAPIPFDAAMARAGQGYGLIKGGQVETGTAQLEEAVAWFERSNLRYTRSSWALRLAEGHLRLGNRARARKIATEVLDYSREAGYRHLEGAAARLLGEILGAEDPEAATSHLDAAIELLGEMDARDELAKALVARADLHRAAGDVGVARRLLTRALEIFESLGTLDGPPLVLAALAALDSEPA